MNEDYKIQTNSEEVARRNREIAATELTPQELAKAIWDAQTLKWQILRGENDSMKAVSNDLKKD